MFEKLKNNLKNNPKAKRLFILIATFEVTAIIILLITFAISASFPDYIKVQGAIDLMKALIEVDGVLLGLSGIMFAQLFSSIMGFQNVMFERMLTRKQNPHFEAYLQEIAERKKILVIATIGGIGFFLGSILTSLISLARVESFDPVKDTYAPFGLTVLPMFCLVEAVAFLVVALAGLPMEPPKIDKSNE